MFFLLNKYFYLMLNKTMLHKLISIVFLLAMVHCTIYTTMAQYKGVKISIVLVEEEENSSQDKSSSQGEKLYEYILTSHKNVVVSFLKNNEWNQQNCYYSLHHKESGLKPPPDNPPEV